MRNPRTIWLDEQVEQVCKHYEELERGRSARDGEPAERVDGLSRFAVRDFLLREDLKLDADFICDALSKHYQENREVVWLCVWLMMGVE